MPRLNFGAKAPTPKDPYEAASRVRRMRNRFRPRNWRLATALTGALVLAATVGVAARGSAAQTETAEASARQEFLKKLVAAAEEGTHHPVRYNPSYMRMSNPGGTIP